MKVGTLKEGKIYLISAATFFTEQTVSRQLEISNKTLYIYATKGAVKI